MSLLSRLTVFLVLTVSFSISQDLTIWVDNVRVGDELPEGIAEVKIHIDLAEEASISGFNISLDAFNSVLDVLEIDQGCLASSIFGEDNINYNGINFFGGSLTNPIPSSNGDTPFLTIRVAFDLNSSNQYLSFGVNEEQTDFYRGGSRAPSGHFLLCSFPS